MKKNLAISILDSSNIPDFLNSVKVAIEDLEKLKFSKQLFEYIIHFDVMDKKFVLNEGIDLKYIRTAKNLGFYADTHLMVSNPILDKYIEEAINYGTDSITIHYEIDNFENVLKYLNNRREELKKYEDRELTIGVSIKPETDIDMVIKYNDKFSKLLIMSVNPGMGGQEYIIDTNNKLKYLKSKLKFHILQIDGGINNKTIINPLRFDVDSFVIGSYLTCSKNTTEIFNKLLTLNIVKDIEEIEKDSNIEFDKKLLQIVPGGYGQDDILIGITVPNIRKCSDKWFKYIDIDILTPFITSNIHEYRRFAIYTMSNMIKTYYATNDNENVEKIYGYLQKNIEYINNWDLTDEVGPNIIAIYLMNKSDEEINEVLQSYINNENIWIKRLGIVNLLTLVRKKQKIDLSINICDKIIYDDNHLIQKAIGWVLREIYKKDSEKIINYLNNKNEYKKLPSFVMSYACEKMSINEKNRCKINK